MVKREIDWKPLSKTTRRNFTTLITFNEIRKPQYNGSCKLKLNLLSKALIVQPKNEDFNDITATFDWKFHRSKNILFVFAKFDFQDFVLVFKNEEICLRVFNGIFKNRDADSVEHELLKDRFLIPLFKNAAKNLRLKEILEKWIQKLDGVEKNEYLKLIRWYYENPEINDNENDIKDVKPEMDRKPLSRKRKRHEVENYKNDISDVERFANETVDELFFENGNGAVQIPSRMHELRSTEFTKVIDASMFKIVNYKSNNLRKLLIFTARNKTKCYEYSFHPKLQFFNHRCKKHGIVKAILDRDDNGNECIKMEDKRHHCTGKIYEPEKYIEVKIVKKPNYEILENCTTQSNRMLIVFDSANRYQCYEYYWSTSQKRFCCYNCKPKRSWRVLADICHENTEFEFIMLSTAEHTCERRKYDREKYFSSNQVVTLPNFEIQTKIRDGNERKTLIIFDRNNRKFCYAYYWYNCRNLFFCGRCDKICKTVTAQICKNDENEDYVILSKTKHVCSPRNYVPQQEIVIIRPPKFKFVEATEAQKSKLFIFDSSNPKLCYVFSQDVGERQYHCHGCKNAQRQKKSDQNKFRTKEVVTVFLGKDNGPNGEYFVEINAAEKHICQPQKYDPEKYEVKILKPGNDHILFQEKSKNGECICLVIFHPDNKKLCYKYFCYKASKSFRCSGCSHKTSIFAKFHQYSDGKEYLTTNKTKHVCTPVNYTSIINPDTVILEKSGFNFNESKKKKLMKIELFDFQLLNFNEILKVFQKDELLFLLMMIKSFVMIIGIKNVTFLHAKNVMFLQKFKWIKKMLMKNM